MMGQVADVSDRRKEQPIPNSAPIDRVHLARYTSGDRTLELEVLSLFAGQAGKCLKDLAIARTPQEWKDAAHGLKGSAKAVGAWEVANLASSAETIEIDSLLQRTAILEALGVALGETTRYITDLGRSGSPS